MAESSPSLMHHVGHKFHEVFQLKPGTYVDLPAAKISEMLKSVSLNKASKEEMAKYLMYSLGEFGLVLHMLINSFMKHVACLLRKVSQEIERHISTQVEHLRTEAYVVNNEEGKSSPSSVMPRDKYPKPLIFHDGRLAFLPTPSATLYVHVASNWNPFGHL